MTTYVTSGPQVIHVPGSLTVTQSLYTGASGAAAGTLAAGVSPGASSFTTAAAAVSHPYAILSAATTSAELVTITNVNGTTVTATVAGAHSNGAPVLFLSSLAEIHAEWFGVTAAGSNTLRREALQKAFDTADDATIYLPPGQFNVNVPASGYIFRVRKGQRIVGGGVSGVGTSIVIATGGADYKAVITANDPITTTSLSGLRLENLMIDQYGPGDTSVPTAPDDPRVCVMIYDASDVHIRGCVFHRSISINTIIFNGDNCKRLYLTDNTFSSVGGAAADFDHSTVYINATDCVIANNSFLAASTLANGARSAIETHGPRMTIHGNKVNGYTIGGNITGVYNGESTGISVMGNQLTNVMNGFILYSRAYRDKTTGFGLSNVHISNNTIDIVAPASRPDGGAVNGIVIETNSDLPLRSIMIIGNSIRSNREASEKTPNNASMGIGFISAEDVDLENLVVQGNSIVNMPGAAIRFDVERLGNTSICNNVITNPGHTLGTITDAYRSGIAVFAADAQQLQIIGNSIVDDEATTRMKYGIYIITTGTDSQDVQIIYNTARPLGATTTAFIAPFITSGTYTRPLLVGVQDDFTVPATIFSAGSRVIDAANGLEFHNVANATTWVTRSFGTAAPGSGTWRRGDVVYNYTPSAGGYSGWICTAAGTPGTWKGFGAIEA